MYIFHISYLSAALCDKFICQYANIKYCFWGGKKAFVCKVLEHSSRRKFPSKDLLEVKTIRTHEDEDKEVIHSEMNRTASSSFEKAMTNENL